MYHVKIVVQSQSQYQNYGKIAMAILSLCKKVKNVRAPKRTGGNSEDRIQKPMLKLQNLKIHGENAIGHWNDGCYAIAPYKKKEKQPQKLAAPRELPVRKERPKMISMMTGQRRSDLHPSCIWCQSLLVFCCSVIASSYVFVITFRTSVGTMLLWAYVEFMLTPIMSCWF